MGWRGDILDGKRMGGGVIGVFTLSASRRGGSEDFDEMYAFARGRWADYHLHCHHSSRDF